MSATTAAWYSSASTGPRACRPASQQERAYTSPIWYTPE
ncbi:MAG: DUF3604 domain-containing protein [Rhodobacteraceae bacterium]|nr:DUF3604 domain-containing protein [Paracoccaceae bacterium]